MTRACVTLPPTDSQCESGGVVVRQGTRRREQALVVWVGGIENFPEPRDQGGSVGFQSIPDYRQFGRRGVEQAFFEEGKLG